MNPAQRAARICLRWMFDPDLLAYATRSFPAPVPAWCRLICDAYPSFRGEITLHCIEVRDTVPGPSGYTEEDLDSRIRDLLSKCAQVTGRDVEALRVELAAA